MLKVKKIFLLLLSILLIGIPILYLPQIIVISKVNCYSQYGVCSQALKDLTTEPGAGKFKELKNDLRKKLKNSIFIERFSIQTNLPNELKVNIIERTPRYLLTDLMKEEHALIDKNGLVLALNENSQLPELVIDGELPKVGEYIATEKLFAFNILEKINRIYRIRQAKLENNSLLVELTDYPRIIFPLEGDNDLLTGSAVFILTKVNKLKIGETSNNQSKISTIDLRYNNPIIKVE